MIAAIEVLKNEFRKISPENTENFLPAKRPADGAKSAPSAAPSDSSFGILKFNRSKNTTKILFLAEIPI